jgi:hypothetical protein
VPYCRSGNLMITSRTSLAHWPADIAGVSLSVAVRGFCGWCTLLWWRRLAYLQHCWEGTAETRRWLARGLSPNDAEITFGVRETA